MTPSCPCFDTDGTFKAFCALHESAEDLLKALKALRPLADVEWVYKTYHAEFQLAGVLIRRAEGRTP